MRAFEWIGLSVALDVPLEWMEGQGFYEIEPERNGLDGPEDAADGLGGDPPGDARPPAGGGDEER
jgi:hypothetical protein